MLSKLELAGFKSEATQGTAIALTAADYTLIQDLSVKPVPEFISRDFRHLSLDALAHTVGSVYVEASGKIELKGSGTKGTALAPLSALFQSAGMAETIAASTSVTYAPTSVPAANHKTPGKSLTMEYYKGGTLTASGLKQVIAGCVCSSLKITAPAGKIAMIEFTLRGLYQEPTDAVAPANTVSAILPAKVQSAAFSLHGTSAIISNLELDFGLSVESRPDVSSANGIAGFVLTDRDPKGSCDPEAELMATANWHTKLTAGTEGALSIAIGATAGNICTITAPKVQIAGLDPTDRNGLYAYSLPLKLNRNTGDDWISIAFT